MWGDGGPRGRISDRDASERPTRVSSNGVCFLTPGTGLLPAGERRGACYLIARHGASPRSGCAAGRAGMAVGGGVVGGERRRTAAGLPGERARDCGAYRAFVGAWIPQGRRAEVQGGGCVRGLGGWAAVRGLSGTGGHRVFRAGGARLPGASAGFCTGGPAALRPEGRPAGAGGPRDMESATERRKQKKRRPPKRPSDDRLPALDFPARLR
jgi:hypothetical protein